MKFSTAARRLASVRLGAALAGAAIASMALAAGAGATVYPANPSVTTNTTGNLGYEIGLANAAGGNNIVLLAPGKYQPATGMTVAAGDHLTITGDHSAQEAAPGGTFQIDGTNQQGQNPVVDLITVAANASLAVEGVEFVNAANQAAAVVNDFGSFNGLNDTFSASHGTPLRVNGGATASLTNSTIDQTFVSNPGVAGTGTVTLTNDTIDGTTGSSIAINSPGTFTEYNTMTLNSPVGVPECTSKAQPGSTGATNNGSLDDDASCGVQYTDTTSVFPTSGKGANGGPTDTYVGFPSTAGLGNAAVCPRFDQRFFLNPSVTGGFRCDIGSSTTSSPAATQETSAGAPKCGTPTVTNTGGVISQTVPVSFSVLGFEGSGTGDIVNSGDAINGIINNNNSLGHGNAPGGITNGTVSLLNPFTGAIPAPASAGSALRVQATKTTTGQPTFWSFTATDWAGLSTYCF